MGHLFVLVLLEETFLGRELLIQNVGFKCWNFEALKLQRSYILHNISIEQLGG